MLMFSSWYDLLVRLAILLVALPVHEWAHAVTAFRLGDDTPLREGRLTLDPRAHLDPVGALLILLTGFGWAKPVRFRPDIVRRRHRYGPLGVALAGPAGNLALAALSVALMLPMRGIGAAGVRMLYGFAFLNLVLFFFNLLPLPPLDGSHVVRELFPRAWARYLAPLQPYALLVFLLLFWVLPRFGLPVLHWLVVTPSYWVLRAWIALMPGL